MKEASEQKNEETMPVIKSSDELLRDNLACSEEILQGIKEIKKYIRLQQIWSIVRLLIIIIPLILGFLYLPPIIKDLIASYKDLQGTPF